MKDTYAACCSTCEGWLCICCREDPKDVAEVYKVAKQIRGSVKIVDAEDIRSRTLPMCECKRKGKG